MEKVSIIVPVYKCENYIEKCIKSIQQQEYGNFELILIIDGNFDNSGNICKRYQNMDSRIKVIEKENEGVSVARNIGINMANGKWIVFVDGDDWIEKNYLTTMVEMAEYKNADICICGYITEFATFSHNNGFFKYDSHDFKDWEKCKLLASCIVNTDISAPNSSTNVGVPWAKIYNAAFVKKNNLTFPKGLKRMQDMIFNLYAFVAASTIYYENIPLYHYLKNSRSSTVGYRPDYCDTAIEIDMELQTFIEHSGYIQLDEVRYCKAILLILEMLQLQFIHVDNRDTFYNKVKKIKEIILKDPFRDSIKKCEGKYLSKAQRVALVMLKRKWIYLMYLCKKIKLLKEKSNMQ